MTTVTEILSRIPSLDGALRRRFTSGLLFLLTISIGILWLPGLPTIAHNIESGVRASNLDWSSLDSIVVAIVFFSVVFVVGTLIDVISDIFLHVIFSIFGGVFSSFRYIVGFIISRRTNVYSNSDRFLFLVRHFSLDLPDVRSKGDQVSWTEILSELPSYVQDGLRYPYRREFGIAFRYLVHIAPDDEKVWLQQIDSRNNNILSVLSTLSLAALFVAILLPLVTIVDESNNLSSPKAKECYIELTSFLRMYELLEPGDYAPIREGIEQEQGWIVSVLYEILSTRSIEDKGKESPEYNLDSLTESYWECRNIPRLETNWTQVSIETTANLVIVTVVALLVLVVAHVQMLRNTVANALDMLCLRSLPRGARKGRSERKELRIRVERILAASGYMMTDVFPDLASGRSIETRQKNPTRYRNPSDPNQTWVGIGRTPKWVNAILTERNIDLATFKEMSMYRVESDNVGEDAGS